MSLASVSANLGLPTAPSLFAGEDFSSLAEAFPINYIFDFRFPGLPEGPPPEPDQLYCPEGCELFDYQSSGVGYLLEHPIALLGDEMGLGKSIQAIAALRLLINRGDVKRCLILSPKSVLFDWYYKLRQWAPDLRVVPIEGPKRRREWYWRCPNVTVNMIGYETWREDVKHGLIDPAEFDMVILDEAQRIKNPDTATHRAVAQIEATWRWALTGTPLENKVEELIAIFAYLKPGLLPKVRKYDPGPVREAIQPYVLRRRKIDVLQHLPPKEHKVQWLDLTPAQRWAYEAAERAGIYAIKQAGQAAAPMIALALITKLKQICNLDHPTEASCKMAWLEAELTRISQAGEKALIFSQYPEKTLKPLMKRMERFGAAIFDGSLSDWKRQMIVHAFQQGDWPGVLAMSLKCGGVGITLTRANHVFHFDHWWNPSAAAQAEDRTHRIGQKKPVYVTTLLTRGTIEERIAELVEQKRELFHKVMDPLTAESDLHNDHDDTSMRKILTRDDLLKLFAIH